MTHHDRDTQTPLQPGGTARRPLRLLIACHEVALGGGYLRFERLGRILRSSGHELAWLCCAEPPAPQFPTRFPRYNLKQAKKSHWDAVMIPGGGFDAETLAWFSALQDRRFGLRVQHVLNEQRANERFEQVHARFAPDTVVFNNVDWPVEMYQRLPARAHHVLVGAVDTVAFRPKPQRTRPLQDGRWVIGGQSRKNPRPLLEALKQLPANVSVRLFGVDTHDVATEYRDLVEAGRLALLGPLTGEAMERFYDDVDCIVMTETLAGWANFVAEAMASEVPAICTPHGTWSIARDGETALVMDAPTPEAIARNVHRLMADPALCLRLATQGREMVVPLSWEAYAHELLDIIERGRDELAAGSDGPGKALESRLNAPYSKGSTALAAAPWRLLGLLRHFIQALKRSGSP